MKLASFESVIRALNEAGVRYLVVGGAAVIAHGFLRYTKDLGFVIRLLPENVEWTLSALTTFGFRPSVSVTAKQFGDPNG